MVKNFVTEGVWDCLHGGKYELCRLWQVDNPLQEAAYPVLLACPTVPQRFGMNIVADTASAGSVRTAALTLRLAVWQRRPAGVVCLEKVEVR